MSSYGLYPNVNGKEQRVHPATDFSHDKGLTVQADRDDADINKIIARFEKTGTISRVNSREPFYGDVSDLTGLSDALIKVQKSNELFMEFDAPIREKFENDSVKFISFLEDPKNAEEALKLGIVNRKPVDSKLAQPASSTVTS